MPMSMPGHKQRQDLVGAVIAGDAPFYGGLDTIKHADTLRVDAERRAARLWGADWCRFSVAGSTHGNQALALAVGQPGQEVIITRMPAPVAAARAGAGRPAPGLGAAGDAIRRRGCPAPVAVRTVRDALAAHPDACAVFLGDPSYVGTIGDLAGHADAAHEAGVPLHRGRGLGRAPRLPPGPAAARDRGRRGRDGDQRAQGAARLHPGRAGAGPHRAPGPGPAGPGVRGHPHDQPDRVDHGQHRRGAGTAGRATASELCARLLRGVATARKRLREVPGRGRARRSRRGADQAGRAAGRHRRARQRVEADLIAAGMPVEMGDRDTIVPIPTIADDEEQHRRVHRGR